MIEGHQIYRFNELLVAYLAISFSHASGPVPVAHDCFSYLRVHPGTPRVRLPCVSQTMEGRCRIETDFGYCLDPRLPDRIW